MSLDVVESGEISRRILQLVRDLETEPDDMRDVWNVFKAAEADFDRARALAWGEAPRVNVDGSKKTVPEREAWVELATEVARDQSINAEAAWLYVKQRSLARKASGELLRTLSARERMEMDL